MNVTYHYLLMANKAMMNKQLLAGLNDTGMTLGQPKVLDYLKDHNGANQKEIAQACYIEAASLTSVLGGMENKGLIERRMMNGNRRSLHVFLTDKGQEMQKKVEERFLHLEKTAFQGISEERIADFMEVFSIIYKNLSEETADRE